jgi:hypothetical protein
MAPVLLLFLVSAFAETLETEWKNVGIGVCTVRLVDGQKLALGEGKAGICQKNTSQGILPQSKYYNASMLMMEPSYLHHDST